LLQIALAALTAARCWARVTGKILPGTKTMVYGGSASTSTISDTSGATAGLVSHPAIASRTPIVIGRIIEQFH
jgi:hypothetical protein